MAALTRPTEATYEVHETVKVDTLDNEDHTFCGIMFPIRAKAVLPVDKIVLRSIAVRGQLGPLSVWITKDERTGSLRGGAPQSPDGEYRIRLSPRHWIKVYENVHAPSQRTYCTLSLTPGHPGVLISEPIFLRPGQMRGIYVHSKLPGDEAIVYDNTALEFHHHQQQHHHHHRHANNPHHGMRRRSSPSDHSSTLIGHGRPLIRRREPLPPPPRYQDAMLALYTGKAHLSPVPFGQVPIWGWGNAWRDRREFVGQVEYGAVYQLWNPHVHGSFGPSFHKAVQGVLACQRRDDCILSRMPDECLYYIFNLCRWDWFGDNAEQLKQKIRARKQELRRRERQRQRSIRQAEAAAAMEVENVVPTAAAAVAAVPACVHASGGGCGGGGIPLAAAVAQQQHHHHSNVMEIDPGHVDNDADDGDLEDYDDADDDDIGEDDDDDDDDLEHMDEDDDDDDDEEDDDESGDWERTHGYRADSTTFSYRYVSSDENDSDSDDVASDQDEEEAAAAAVAEPFYRGLLARAWVLRRLGRDVFASATANASASAIAIQQHQQQQRQLLLSDGQQPAAGDVAAAAAAVNNNNSDADDSDYDPNASDS